MINHYFGGEPNPPVLEWRTCLRSHSNRCVLSHPCPLGRIASKLS